MAVREFLLAASLLLGGGDVDAVLVPIDMTEAGDQLITLDTDTGLQWLDLSLTLGLSVDEVRGGSGGLLAVGWRFATTAEMCSLFDRSLLSQTPCPHDGENFVHREAEVAAFLDLFGATFIDGDLEYAAGYFDNELDMARFGIAFVGNEEAQVVLFNDSLDREFYVVGEIGAPTDFSSPDFASFLVRVPVPEPSSAALVALGLACLSRFRTDRQKRSSGGP